MSEIHSDHGTVLQSDQAAITWSPSDGFCFLMPHFADDADVPAPVMALAALAMKLQDETFLQELVDEFNTGQQN